VRSATGVGTVTVGTMAHSPAHTPPALPSLGVVYLPSGAGTPVGRFEFLVDPETGRDVEIGSLVAAETDEGVVVGSVVDMRTVGTDGDPVAAETSRRPHPERIGYVPAVRAATVQVLAADRLRPIGAGEVRAASAQEVGAATGQHTMAWPIPIGAVQLADGAMAPVCVEGSFVLGPEAQGLGVFGRSGVASKTSFMTVALRSALAAGNEHEHRVAAIVFNVKGEDLVWIDQRPEENMTLTETDIALYQAMGVSPDPFDDVTVWATRTFEGGPVRCVRDDANVLRWDLRMAWQYLRFFFPAMYEDEKLATFVAQFEDILLKNPSATMRVDTFEKLEAWFAAEIEQSELNGGDYIWNGRVHVATARRLRRQFAGLRARGQGLFCGGNASSGNDIADTGWHNGQVQVVDLAGLSAEVQGFVIARTVDRLMRAAEEGRLGVDHLVVLTDELNQWAPAGAAGEFATVRKSLQKVATQGRYAGMALFGAAQAASKIDDLLRDNSATRALGSSAEAELSSGVHGRLPAGLVERLATLPKGQMAVWHTAFRQAIVVRFPRPAWKMGRSRTTAGTRPSTGSVLREHLGTRGYDRLTTGVGEDVVEMIASGAGSMAEIMEGLEEARDQTPRGVHEPRRFDPENPFDLE
jgi:uncharacterized protein